ncbi:hypothetical protein [Xylella fastidiosa]|nr:hypothetical protein [Xylella fastidiosa]
MPFHALEAALSLPNASSPSLIRLDASSNAFLGRLILSGTQ